MKTFNLFGLKLEKTYPKYSDCLLLWSLLGVLVAIPPGDPGHTASHPLLPTQHNVSLILHCQAESGRYKLSVSLN